MTKQAINDRLEAIRASLQAENISYGELAELQELAPYIDSDDVELLEAAGVSEFHESENDNCYECRGQK